MAKDNYYIGIDLGGTKVYAALVAPGGAIAQTCKIRTPQTGGAKRGELVLKAIKDCTDQLISHARKKLSGDVAAIALAVPGPVDYVKNSVPVMPNLDIGGANLASSLSKEISLPVKLANDVDAIVLGEAMFGPAACGVKTMVDLAVGTGIGGGIVIDGKLYSGAAGSCAEVGHMLIEPDGPECGCGNRGCLETFASRTAIERMLKDSIANGKQSIITELMKPEDKRIRSGVLAKALKAGDKPVEKALTKASKALARACISLKHLLGPELIVLGGGVMESCGYFMLPIVRQQVEKSTFMAGHKMQIILSALGDEAGVLGAAAMAMEATGLTPEQITTPPATQASKGISITPDGFDVNGELFFAGDMTVTVDGEVMARRKDATETLSSPAQLKLRDVQRACKAGPHLLLIGSDAADKDPLRNKIRQYLDTHAIQYQLLSGDEAISAYNNTPTRTALMLLMG